MIEQLKKELKDAKAIRFIIFNNGRITNIYEVASENIFISKDKFSAFMQETVCFALVASMNLSNNLQIDIVKEDN